MDTTTTLLPQAELDVQPDSLLGEADPRCAACEHELADHDPIGLRYCQASQANGLVRGCLCRKN